VIGVEYLIGAEQAARGKKDHAPSSDVGHDPVIFDKVVVQQQTRRVGRWICQGE
jgi:hypothetical protein